MTNTEKADAIFKRLVREKKAQPGGEWDKTNLPMAKKIMIKAIADELKRMDQAGLGQSEQAKAIYNEYPRKVAPSRAYSAIQKAIKLHGYSHVLERTKKYAECVTRWSHDWRFRGSAGSDIVPHPASWYNAGSYDDDQAEWVGDRKYNINPTPVGTIVEAPNGWVSQLIIKYPEWTSYKNGVKRKDGTYFSWNDLPVYIQQELVA
jgi:hypothetical protein